jgi:beta-glucanase (GH16 family)
MHSNLPLLAALALLATPLAGASTAVNPSQPEPWEWDTSHAGEPLDLSHCQRTFFDDFSAISITAPDGAGPWYAAVHDPFGAAAFLPPGPQGTYQTGNGLTIRAEKVDGAWQSGLIQTVDWQGRGFAQQYGYFEMEAEFPRGIGSWPAFWLLSQNEFLNKTKPKAEVDVVEWYGRDPTSLHACVHLRPPPLTLVEQFGDHKAKEKITSLCPTVPYGRLEGPHTYGAEVTPDWIIIYFDQHELERIKTPPEFKTPLYMVADLAISNKDDQESPKEMRISHVAAYALSSGSQS